MSTYDTILYDKQRQGVLITWNRPEAAAIGALYAHVSPHYAAVVESYNKAQEVAKQQAGPSRE